MSNNDNNTVKIIIGEKIRYTTGGGSAPTNNTPPSISGVAVVGQTLTVTAGSWSGSPTVRMRIICLSKNWNYQTSHQQQ